MKFIRRYSYNIYKEDDFFQQKSDTDRPKEEVIDDVDSMQIFTRDGSFDFSDSNTKEVIESFNYFTAVCYNKIIAIKYTDVIRIEIKLKPEYNIRNPLEYIRDGGYTRL